ncbi:colicin Z C-terminal domain-related protein [Halarcobacter anaerophilus]|jgi:hypothetical protein|uniref:Uncharacterized protein n=1 Tax=Halarcobacter anaerophilus TaxID=877500 RepID=A0A4Q0XY63_9BACT|nr:colicin Z C-terminal domain-related protein [Halarcobacter anaerophilus]QDF28402.1 hypothetical protein AANAER_0911 [Halarcobacter anaerophilus]RXJ61684.1 hypothetical protein CRV06_12815 [Halarcobacter anaerophilus]
MVLKEIQTWVPPLGLGWSKWINIISHYTKGSYIVEFKSLSNVKSTFDIEVREGGKTMTRKIIGPGKTRITSSNCACITRARFSSHTVGQNILILVKV